MGLSPFIRLPAFPKTLLQPWLVATPKQLILGNRKSEKRTAQKDLFLERWVATRAVLGGKKWLGLSVSKDFFLAQAPFLF